MKHIKTGKRAHAYRLRVEPQSKKLIEVLIKIIYKIMNYILYRQSIPEIKHLFRIMKIAVIVLFTCVYALLAVDASSQNVKVSIQADDFSVQQVIGEIEKQTDYLFVYDKNEVNINRRVSFNATNEQVSEILNRIFEGTDIVYKLVGKNITLIRQGNILLKNVVNQQTPRKVTGKIVDQNGEPAIGVNIVEKGTTNGTVTDIDGYYSIEVSPSSVLIISYIGYISQEIKVEGRDDFFIQLKEDSKALDEVVVVGYGTMRKKDLTGAIANIKTEKLEKEAPRSLQELLRANAAGLIVNMPTTAKGNGTIQLRGKGTLKAGASPLIVLDGVIYEGDVSDINPIDISAIDVLKDASSSAVYGAKAANGVIVITTKKGRPTGKPVLTFNANIGFVQSANSEKPLDESGFIKYRQDYNIGRNTDEYHAKYPQMFINPNELNGVSQLDWYNYDQKVPVTSVTPEDLTRSWLARLNFTSPEIDNYLGGITTDWTDKVFQLGLQQDYSVSISNKTEDMSYYWSIGYADREGIITGERFTTFRTRLNLESKITDFLSVGLNSNFSTRNEGFLSCAWDEMTHLSPFTTDNRNDPDSPYQRLPSGVNLIVNPFYDNQFVDRKDLYHNFNASIYTKIKLPFGIEYQMNFTPYYRWREYYNHKSSKNELWAETGGSSERTNQKTFNWQIDNVLRWSQTFNKKHRTEVTLLANAEKGQNWKTTAKASNFVPSDILGYHNIGAGSVQSNSSEDNYSTGDALMARAFYSYDNKYMITSSVRRDGYSAFGQKNPRAIFPAVALGWTFTSENFMEKTNSWLNYGKLRLSWGENGNRDIGQYEALSTMKSSLYPYLDVNGNAYLYSLLYINKMANVDLKWERTASFNFGLDFSVLNERLSGSLETYVSTTNDLLVDRSLPQLTGFKSVASNLGQLQNKGFEVTLNADLINNHNFAWNVSGNFSLNRRKIKKLYGDMIDIKDDNGNVIGQKEADDIKNKWFIGQDPDRIWDYERDGVWSVNEEEEAYKYGCQPGDFKYIDQDKDGVMTDNDKVFQGYKTPRFRWTLRNEFTFWNNLSLSCLLYSYWGHYGEFNKAANGSDAERYSSYDFPRWTPDNQINDYARLGSKNIGNNYVERSFIRLENVTLSYNVPENLLRMIKVQNMRFSLSVRNVAVFAPKWKFWDPENSNPTPRTFNLSVNFIL